MKQIIEDFEKLDKEILRAEKEEATVDGQISSLEKQLKDLGVDSKKVDSYLSNLNKEIITAEAVITKSYEQLKEKYDW